jgi:hypothetical protein
MTMIIPSAIQSLGTYPSFGTLSSTLELSRKTRLSHIIFIVGKRSALLVSVSPGINPEMVPIDMLQWLIRFVTHML